jgi:uncharacterized glyoxalase superfamily protein PhnB
MSTVWPILHYDDPEAAVAFLTEVLGFICARLVRDDDGDVAHAELSWDGGGFVNLGGTKHQGGVHAAMRPGTNAVYVVTRDVDAVFERVRGSRRGRIINPPADTAFAGGAVPVRAGTLANPEGNLWTFGDYPGP